MKLWGEEARPRRLAAEGVEVWALLHEGRYAVSNLGNLLTRTKWEEWRPINPTRHHTGYESVGFTREPGGKAKTYLVHRVVVEAFDGAPPSPDHTDVRHLDGDKRNNVLTNLCWGTRSENMLDVVKHRQGRKEPAPAEIEGDSWYQGYTADDYLVRVGLELYYENVVNIAHLERLWRCSRDVAANIIHGKTRLHVPRPEGNPKKQKRRSNARKEAIMALVKEGKNAAQINEALGETLTAQDVYYYRSKVKAEGGERE